MHGWLGRLHASLASDGQRGGNWIFEALSSLADKEWQKQAKQACSQTSRSFQPRELTCPWLRSPPRANLEPAQMAQVGNGEF